MPYTLCPTPTITNPLKPLAVSLLSVGAITGLSLSLAQAATPQETPQQLGAVVVTATKVGEVNAQKTPESISVYDQTTLQEGNINNVEDLERLTPGLNVTRNGQAARLYMRGIGSSLDFVGTDPSVTVHVDGVYQSRGLTALNDFLNVDRIEVLRGPQGTLYGRNSTGGTINIITRLPGAKPEANISAEVGDYNMHKVTAVASGGIGSDQLIGSVAAMQTEHDPYVENVVPGGKDGLLDDNTKSANASLRALLGGGNEMVLRVDATEENKTTGAYKSTGLDYFGNPTTTSTAADIPTSSHETAINVDNPFVDIRSWGDSVEFNVALAPGWVLTSLTAYRDVDYETLEDTDGTRINRLMTELAEQQHQISQELRVRYNTDKTSWVGGLYLLREGHESQVHITNLGGVSHLLFDANNDVRANALFSQGSWQISKPLRATVGLRYSQEEKRFENDVDLVTSLGVTPRFQVDENADWDNWSPKLTLDYAINDNALIYIDASKGFKSGGFNLTSALAKYEPEKVTAYEIGTKLDWLDNSLRTNISAFYYDYTDLQVQAFSVPGSLIVNNAASAISQGIELENQWLIGDSWAFDLNYAYLDAKYDKYLTPLPPTNLTLVDVSGNHLNAAPRHKITPAIRFYQDSAVGLWSARLEYAWQDEQFFTPFNEEVSSQEAYGLVNLMIGLTAPDESWELQLYGQNLEDEEYSTSSREFLGASTATGVTKDINPPRTVSARLAYHFR